MLSLSRCCGSFRAFSVFSAPLFLFSSFLLGTAQSSTLKIGILAPTLGNNQSIGHQIIAGATIAAHELKNIDATLVYKDWDGVSVEKALSSLESENPAFIIVGIDAENLPDLFSILEKRSRSERTLPYIFLARNHTSKNLMPLKKFNNILSYGYTYFDFHRLSLNTWSKKLNIKNPMVLYAKGQGYIQQTELLKAALKNKNVQIYPLNKLKVALKQTSYPDGIVLAGSPVAMAKAASQIKKKGFDFPIFLSGTFGGPNLGIMTSINLPNVYYSSMWMSGNNTENNMMIGDFSGKANKLLGWQSYSFSSFAVDAYEAVNIGLAASRKWDRIGQTISIKDLWSVLKTAGPIKSLTGGEIRYWKEIDRMVNTGYLVESHTPNRYRLEVP